MFDTFIIYINTEEDLIESQKILFREGYKWKSSTTNEICHFRLPIYLFISNNIITWSDDNSIVFESSAPKFSFKEYLRFKKV